MVPTEGLTIAPLGLDAITEGLALTVEAGWNQTSEDWAFFVSHGTVLGARDNAQRLLATSAVLPYSSGFAWVSLVIVAKSHRGRGLGTRMLERCLEILRQRSLVGMLDATPAGERIYAPLGFRPLFALERWEGAGGRMPARALAPGQGGVQRFNPSELRRVCALDASAFGADRGALLADFGARDGALAFLLEDASGYAVARRGRAASQVGPVVAPNEPRAVMLLHATIAATSGEVFVDVPDRWTGIAASLRALGFRSQRPFLRMALGSNSAYGDGGRIFAIAGPEYG